MVNLTYQELTELIGALEDHRECLKHARRALMDHSNPNIEINRAHSVRLGELRQVLLAQRSLLVRPAPAAKPAPRP
jgi:hypothetical protein